MSSVVELYVLQLKSLLPRKQRDDIAAEIRESIASAVDERERTLGRKLEDRETSEILKTYGHPIAVAGRYLPMQQLIGPSGSALWYVIQAVLVVIAAIGGIVAAIALFTEPRATQAAIQVLVRFFWIALDAGALVTVAFVLLDRRHVRFRFIDDFDARKLGRDFLGMRSAPLDTIPRWDTVLELAMIAILLLWWIGLLVFPTVQFGVKVELGSAIERLQVPVLVLCVLDLLRLGTDLAYPYRTLPRILVAVVSNFAWLALLVLAFASQTCSKLHRASRIPPRSLAWS